MYPVLLSRWLCTMNLWCSDLKPRGQACTLGHWEIVLPLSSLVRRQVGARSGSPQQWRCPRARDHIRTIFLRASELYGRWKRPCKKACKTRQRRKALVLEGLDSRRHSKRLGNVRVECTPGQSSAPTFSARAANSITFYRIIHSFCHLDLAGRY